MTTNLPGMSLRDLRKNAGLTQRRLAFLVGVSHLTILNYERGNTEPNASMVRKLAWALRVSENEILEAIIDPKERAAQ